MVLGSELVERLASGLGLVLGVPSALA
jgi:hypothetical protein